MNYTRRASDIRVSRLLSHLAWPHHRSSRILANEAAAGLSRPHRWRAGLGRPTDTRNHRAFRASDRAGRVRSRNRHRRAVLVERAREAPTADCPGDRRRVAPGSRPARAKGARSGFAALAVAACLALTAFAPSAKA